MFDNNNNSNQYSPNQLHESNDSNLKHVAGNIYPPMLSPNTGYFPSLLQNHINGRDKSPKMWKIRRFKLAIAAITMFIINAGVLALGAYTSRHWVFAKDARVLFNIATANSAITGAAAVLAGLSSYVLAKTADVLLVKQALRNNITLGKIDFLASVGNIGIQKTSFKYFVVTTLLLTIFNQYSAAIPALIGMHAQSYLSTINAEIISPASTTLVDDMLYITSNPYRPGNFENNLQQMYVAMSTNDNITDLTVLVSEYVNYQSYTFNGMMSTADINNALVLLLNKDSFSEEFSDFSANFTDVDIKAFQSQTGDYNSLDFQTLKYTSTLRYNTNIINSSKAKINGKLVQYTVITDNCGIVNPVYNTEVEQIANAWACMDTDNMNMYVYTHIIDNETETLIEAQVTMETTIVNANFNAVNNVFHQIALSSTSTAVDDKIYPNVVQYINSAWGYHIGARGSNNLLNIYKKGSYGAVEFAIAMIAETAMCSLSNGVTTGDKLSMLYAVNMNVYALGPNKITIAYLALPAAMTCILIYCTIIIIKYGNVKQISALQPSGLIAMSINSPMEPQLDGTCTGILSKNQRNIRFSIGELSDSHLALTTLNLPPPRERKTYGSINNIVKIIIDNDVVFKVNKGINIRKLLKRVIVQNNTTPIDMVVNKGVTQNDSKILVTNIKSTCSAVKLIYAVTGIVINVVNRRHALKNNEESFCVQEEIHNKEIAKKIVDKIINKPKTPQYKPTLANSRKNVTAHVIKTKLNTYEKTMLMQAWENVLATCVHSDITTKASEHCTNFKDKEMQSIDGKYKGNHFYIEDLVAINTNADEQQIEQQMF